MNHLTAPKNGSLITALPKHIAHQVNHRIQEASGIPSLCRDQHTNTIQSYKYKMNRYGKNKFIERTSNLKIQPNSNPLIFWWLSKTYVVKPWIVGTSHYWLFNWRHELLYLGANRCDIQNLAFYSNQFRIKLRCWGTQIHQGCQVFRCYHKIKI